MTTTLDTIDTTTTRHDFTLEAKVTWRGDKPDRVRFRDRCSCGGWVGEWVTRAGLAHAAWDAHVEEEGTR